MAIFHTGFLRRISLLILLLVLFLSGCNFPYPPMQTSPSAVPGRAKPSVTLTPIPTATYTPTQTATLTPSPTPTSTSTTTPTPACLHGVIEQHEVEDPGLSQPLRFRVYLPPCYGADPQRTYPVLYLLHGQSFNESQWDDLGMDEAADAMISSGQIEPLIIVMPGEDKWLEDAVSSKFAPALVNTLVPWVDDHYATCPGRTCRALGGLSRGAGWAMRIGIFHPELFSILGGHSLALFDGDVNYLPLLLTRMEEDLRPKIYLDVGESDRWKDSIAVFVAKLVYIKINPEYIVQPGKHEEAYWKEHAPEYLLWYARTLAQP